MQYIAIIVAHDFGLPNVSQSQNIVLLQLIIITVENTITLNLEPNALKTKIRTLIF